MCSFVRCIAVVPHREGESEFSVGENMVQWRIFGLKEEIIGD